MPNKRQKYDEEFKKNAVRLSFASNRTFRQTADDLGIEVSKLPLGSDLQANCHWGQTYTFDKMWISGGMIKSLLKIILGRPSCVKEQ